MMRAARYYGNKDLRIEEVPRPVPRENEVLIDIEWCGICGTDLHEYEYGPIVTPRAGHPHPITGEVMPVTLGHEFCGRVSKTSPSSPLQVGDAVMVDPRLFCKSCPRCAAGATNGCHSWGFHGLSGRGGGFSECVAVDASMVHALPESADLSVAALIEPLAVANRAVKNSGIADFAAKTVLVLGGGPISLAVTANLRRKGARAVYVSEPTPKRQQQNVEFADAVFDPRKEKVGDRCRELTGGEGVHVVFDCAGNEFAMKDGMDALSFGGSYINVAAWVSPFVIPQVEFMMKEIKIFPSIAYNEEDFRETVEGFSTGAFPGIEKFVSSRILLEDLEEKGIKELISNTSDHIKILVSPKAEYFK